MNLSLENSTALIVVIAVYTRGGGGGVVLRIMAHTGRLCPQGIPFSGFRYMKKYGSLVIVYERVEKSVIFVSKKAQKD